jgi:N-acylneuraminate cytidylyltransferase
VNILAVILARAGSAGLKDKHLRPLSGRPVIDYTFDHARAARRLTRVVVSTDCPAVRNTAERLWFETIARPANLATADASVQDVMLHALETVESRSSFHADGLVVLYGNVPVRPAGVIDDAVSLLETSKCDSVRSFCPVGKWHPSWMSWLDGDRVESLQSGSIHRRQGLAPLYLHDGAVVAVSRSSMLRGKKMPEDPHAFFGVDRRAVRTEMGETVEIDHLRDLYLAEAILRDRIGTSTRMAS